MIDPQLEVPLRAAAPEELAVYLHLPFCSTRCGYCDFYSETSIGSTRMAATLDEILREAAWYRSLYPNSGVRSIYVGGGTPSLIPAALLAPFLGRLRTIFDLTEPHLPAGSNAGTEWSFEANPESIDRQKLQILAELGVNRLSIGVQSFQNRFLRSLDRQADQSSVVRALEFVASLGAFELSMDLMTGLPGQSTTDAEHDLQRLLSYKPGHVSVYSLTVEEGTPLAKQVRDGQVALATAQHRDRVWTHVAAQLRRTGYMQYEISNFCLPGKQSRHNSWYWQGKPYLGLGPGAVGTLPLPGTSPQAVRISNPVLSQYLPAGHGAAGPGATPPHHCEQLSAAELLLERFLLGLRTQAGVALGPLAQELMLNEAALRNALSSWRGAAYLDQRCLPRGRVVLRQAGRLVLDSLLPDLAQKLEGLHPVASSNVK